MKKDIIDRLLEKGAKRHYRIKSCEAGSRKFGLCEVCGKEVSETFIQSLELHLNDYRYSAVLFGHEQCLIRSRKPV